MQILNSHGAAYFDSVDLSRDFDGDWFSSPGAGNTISLTGELDLFGGATISGELSAEFTCDPLKVKAIVPMTMPDGCMHTARAEIVWTAPGHKITFTAVPSGTLGLTFVFVPLAHMRFRWHPTSLPSVVTGVSKFTLHATRS